MPTLWLACSRLLIAAAVLLVGSQATPLTAHELPILFFHGVSGNASNGDNFKAALATDARPFIALTFCQNACSFSDLNYQTTLAIAQIRQITASDPRFDDGYVFLAHSQGAAIARAVIETMDDHKVHTFISLAGAVNGVFYGPQASDLVPALVNLKSIAPLTMNKTLFDYTAYSAVDIVSGRFQAALTKLHIDHPELQQLSSTYQLARSPYESPWLDYSPFYPMINNIHPATDDAERAAQARRKANFLKLTAAHFFASPHDEIVSPWQAALLAKYTTVDTLEALTTSFRQLQILPMTETPEYMDDTYGLKTLDQRGGLFLHTVENVPHVAWVGDTVSLRNGSPVGFQSIFAATVFPLLKPETPEAISSPSPSPSTPTPSCSNGSAV